MPKISVITINVPDMDQAIAFYSDQLGFPIESKQWYPEIVQLKHEGISLILYKVSQAAEVDYPNVAQTVLGIATPDLKETLTNLRALGVRVIHDEPQPFPAGIYSAIRDPFGNVVELLQFQR